MPFCNHLLLSSQDEGGGEWVWCEEVNLHEILLMGVSNPEQEPLFATKCWVRAYKDLSMNVRNACDMLQRKVSALAASSPLSLSQKFQTL